MIPGSPSAREQWIPCMLKECEAALYAERLTAWESNFIESISDQWEERGTLTQDQLTILEQIYAEKC